MLSKSLGETLGRKESTSRGGITESQVKIYLWIDIDSNDWHFVWVL